MRSKLIRHSRSLPVVGHMTCNHKTTLHEIELYLSKRHVTCSFKCSPMRCRCMRFYVYTRRSGCNGVANNPLLARLNASLTHATPQFTVWRWFVIHRSSIWTIQLTGVSLWWRIAEISAITITYTENKPTVPINHSRHCCSKPECLIRNYQNKNNASVNLSNDAVNNITIEQENEF